LIVIHSQFDDFASNLLHHFSSVLVFCSYFASIWWYLGNDLLVFDSNLLEFRITSLAFYQLLTT